MPWLQDFLLWFKSFIFNLLNLQKGELRHAETLSDTVAEVRVVSRIQRCSISPVLPHRLCRRGQRRPWRARYSRTPPPRLRTPPLQLSQAPPLHRPMNAHHWPTGGRRSRHVTAAGEPSLWCSSFGKRDSRPTPNQTPEREHEHKTMQRKSARCMQFTPVHKLITKQNRKNKKFLQHNIFMTIKHNKKERYIIMYTYNILFVLQ